MSGRVGGPLTLTLDAGGWSASAVWDGPLAAAEKRPATAADLREQLGRLSDTPFKSGELTAALPDPVLVPQSVLNDLRRRAVSSY